jgi:hypothetical protein
MEGGEAKKRGVKESREKEAKERGERERQTESGAKD